MKKKIIRISAVLVLVILAIGYYYGSSMLPIATAYSSKIMCSCVFVSGREEAPVLEQDLSSFGMVDISVNYLDSTVTSKVMGMAERTAVFRNDLGCTLAVGTSPDSLKSKKISIDRPDQRQANNYWPTGDNFAGGHFPACLLYTSDAADD